MDAHSVVLPATYGIGGSVVALAAVAPFDFQGWSLLIGALGGGIGGLLIGAANAWVIVRPRLTRIEHLVNGVATELKVQTQKVAAAQVEIASLEGENRGRLEEQASPKVDAIVPGKTELSQPIPKKRRTKTRETNIKPRATKSKSRKSAKKK